MLRDGFEPPYSGSQALKGEPDPIQYGTQLIYPSNGKEVETIAGQKGERLQSIQLGAVKRVAGIMPESPTPYIHYTKNNAVKSIN